MRNWIYNTFIGDTSTISIGDTVLYSIGNQKIKSEVLDFFDEETEMALLKTVSNNIILAYPTEITLLHKKNKPMGMFFTPHNTD